MQSARRRFGHFGAARGILDTERDTDWWYGSGRIGLLVCIAGIGVRDRRLPGGRHRIIPARV